MMSSNRSKCGAHVLAVLISICMVACGGGGGGGTAPAAPAVTVAPPVLAAQPQPATAVTGTTATFAVTAGGDAPLTYQWQKNGAAIAGATASSYTTPVLALADTGATYGVTVRNSAGSVVSQAVGLSVVPIEPVLSEQPASATATVGGTVTFAARSTGAQPLAYQWFRGGIALPGATSSSLAVNPVSYGDDGVSYTVQVKNQAGSASSQAALLSVKAAQAPTPVQACIHITTPGSYLLGNDLAAAGPNGSTCIAIDDTRDVQLDCAGHRIRGIAQSSNALEIRNVRNFAVKNCTLDSDGVFVIKSSAGSFTQNTFTPQQSGFPNVNIHFTDVTRSVFANNTVTGSYGELYGDSNTISNNRFSSGAAPVAIAGMVVSDMSAHVRIFGNTMDGRWDGVVGSMGGADDGVIIVNSSDALVENNTIANVFDCGIEWLGTINASTFRGNHISNAGVCGLGGWYGMSMSDSVIAANTIDRTSRMFLIFRISGLLVGGDDFEHRLPPETAIAFKNNLFDGNIFTNSRQQNPGTPSFIPLFNLLNYSGIGVPPGPGERLTTAADFQISNNTFKNNQFGSSLPPPWFGDTPVPGMVIDGGGNVCKQSTIPGYPLTCKP